MKLRFAALMTVFLCTGAAWDAVAASYKLEPIPAAPEGLSSTLQAVLQSQGYKVVNEQGVALVRGLDSQGNGKPREAGFARRKVSSIALGPAPRSDEI